MHVLVSTLGTRGDFELFLILAHALRRRGHEVVVATSPFFCTRVRDDGFEWVAVGAGSREDLIEVVRSLAAVPDPVERTRAMVSRWIRRELGAGMPRLTAAAGAADYVVTNLRIMLRRGDETIPTATVLYDPPTSPADLVIPRPPDADRRVIDLVAMPQALVDPCGQWGPGFAFTGFWLPPPVEWTPPRELRAFLEAGPPPVIVTMGSMAMQEPATLVRAVAEALARSGRRGVLMRGWFRDAAGSRNLLVVDDAPYGWLFPRAACIVHHGGTGTVAAALAAGVPSILLPQISSQVQYGRMLTEAGVATGVFASGVPEPAALAEAIGRAVGDREVHERVRAWRGRVLAEPGVEAAVDRIERHWAALTRPPGPH